MRRNRIFGKAAALMLAFALVFPADAMALAAETESEEVVSTQEESTEESTETESAETESTETESTEMESTKMESTETESTQEETEGESDREPNEEEGNKIPETQTEEPETEETQTEEAGKQIPAAGLTLSSVASISQKAEDPSATIGQQGYSSLQEAIDNADGGTVVLQKDVEETVTISGSVTVDLNNHTIDGKRQDSVITVDGGDVVIKNGTVTGNEAAGTSSSGKGNGGGIFVLGGTKVRIIGCIVENNTAFTRGGGIAVSETYDNRYLETFVVEDTIVRGNTVSNGKSGKGAGIYLGIAVGCTLEEVEVTGNQVLTEGNSLTSGGGIYVFGSKAGNGENPVITLKGVECSGNVSSRGAEFYDSSRPDVTIVLQDCSFVGTDYSGAKPSVESAVYVDGEETGFSMKGCTISGYRGLTGSPVELRHKASITDCTVSDNEAAECGGIFYSGDYDWEGELALVNTVVTRNVATDGKKALSGGVAVKNGVFAQRETNGTYGAIYGNTTAGSNQANDLCVDYGIARVGAADAMRDPAREESFFADYVWKDYAAGNTYEDGFSKTFTDAPLALTAVENRKRDVAQIGGEIYQTLAEAVNALTDGSVIRLIAGENDDYGLTVDTDTIRVEKPVTIELNGRDIGPSEKILFEVEAKGILTLQGEGQVQGTIRILDGQAILSGSAAAKKVVQEGGSLLLNSACGPLELSLGEGKAASYGSDFAPEKITVNLAEEVLKAVNEGTAEKVVLLTPQEGADGSSLLEKITVSGWTNRLYRLTVLPSGEIVLQKDTTPAVYVNGISGDDSAYGLSVDTPVRTLKQAEAIAREKGYSRIYVTGTLSVSGEETWSLAEGLTVKRYPDYDGNLIAVKDGGSLTLDEGAVLQNNSRVDPDTNAHMAGAQSMWTKRGRLP